MAFAGFAAAVARGLDPRVALGELSLGAGIIFFWALVNSARPRPPSDLPPVPTDARYANARQTIVPALFPSTVGLTLLTLVALAVDARLAAILAGIVGGLGLAGIAIGGQLLWAERRAGARIFAEPGRRERIFVRR